MRNEIAINHQILRAAQNKAVIARFIGDFRRCVALVEQIPEIRDSFDKVAKRVPAFKGILNEWDSLVALLKSEMKAYGNKAPETYRRISELRKD
ncbi:host cell division inhibitory peptide Kil [Escherichia coli]|uniref:host cell division inhibitory peptide Kil n=1 Tax=Escherichia coli TaxID=562 RepID=UPI00280AFF57|nr:hypothetical protein [Escherichia coli]